MRLRLEVKHAEVVTTARSCMYQTPIRSDGKNRGWADATRMAKITGNSRIQGITPMSYRYYLHQNRDYPDEDPGAPKRLESEHRLGDSFDGPVVLLDDVVEVFVLTHQDVYAGISLDAFNGGRIGAALVDGDLLWHIVQVDGPFQKAARRSLISLGSQKKIHCIAGTINRTVKVLPLACHFDVGFIHSPAQTNRSFAPPKHAGQHRQHLCRPAMQGGVVNKNTALLHHFLHMSQTQRVGHVPAHASQHDFQRVVEPFEHLLQGAIDQTFAKIKHGRDCRLCLLRQNHKFTWQALFTPH